MADDKCSQCDRAAIVVYGNHPLCVEHHLKMQQATYLQVSQVVANLNYLSEEIARGTGYILPPNKVELPRPPFVGDNLTLTNINVSKSTIGSINTGTIQNLDAAITLFREKGNEALAQALKDFTEALIASKEIEAAQKQEISDAVEFLVGQTTSKPTGRVASVAKTTVAGIRAALRDAAALAVVWDKLEPLIRAAITSTGQTIT